eukprot:GFUD01014490.1.p1 GENE.GFUD01014490.1~~GFUD01014490.1.p1  ORF type:complete len:182 (-),score=39.45 GFUD01014490.1:440-985(-)
MDGIEIAPFRSLDEFLLSQSRFQIPDFNNPEKWSNRIVNNLLYYQTNYFLSAVLIFLVITFLNPGHMILGIITMASIFGLLYYLSFKQAQVKNIKKNHPMVVMISTFCVGYFFIYQIGCVIAFLLGVMMPVVFTVVHASLRLRNIKNKVTSVAETLGVSKKTPMALFLDEWGIEPEVKYLS